MHHLQVSKSDNAFPAVSGHAITLLQFPGSRNSSISPTGIWNLGTSLCLALLYFSCLALAYTGSSGPPECLDPGRRRGKGTRQFAGPQEAKKTRAGEGRWGCRGGGPGGAPAGGCAAVHTPTSALLAGFLHSQRSHPSASSLHCSLHVAWHSMLSFSAMILHHAFSSQRRSVVRLKGIHRHPTGLVSVNSDQAWLHLHMDFMLNVLILFYLL